MISDSLSQKLEQVAKATCLLMNALQKAPRMEGLSDEKLEKIWMSDEDISTDLRHEAARWGKQCRKLSEACIREILDNSGDDAKELLDIWSEPFKGARSGANQDEIINYYSEELALLMSRKNKYISQGDAQTLLDSLHRKKGIDHWKYRNTIVHIDDGSYGKQARKTLKNVYGRIGFKQVFENSSSLVEIYDIAIGERPGTTVFTDLVNEAHENQKHSVRHKSWFVVKRLGNLDWGEYVETANLTGENGLIQAVYYDNLSVVVGDGGLGKTALVYEFIRRNYKDQTGFEDPDDPIITNQIDPFEYIIIFSTKHKKQGEMDTTNPGRGLIDPDNPRISIRNYLKAGRAYDRFLEVICDIGIGEREASKKAALEVLMETNALIVLDNYEDIERDEEYIEDKEKLERFLKSWAKKLVEKPKARIIMTSRTGLLQFSRTGTVEMQKLTQPQSMELLERRYHWLYDNLGGAPTKRILDSVLERENKIIEQVMEDHPDFKEELWGHPLLIQLVAMLLRQEEKENIRSTGSEMVERVIAKVRDPNLTGDVYEYIVKKTIDSMFTDVKEKHLLQIIIQKRDRVTIPILISESNKELSITKLDVVKFKTKLQGLGWLEMTVVDGTEEFRLFPSIILQIELSEGESIEVASEKIEQYKSEPWQEIFPAVKYFEGELRQSHFSDHKRLVQICKLLVERKEKIDYEELSTIIQALCNDGLYRRRLPFLENWLLANQIARKFMSDIKSLPAIDEEDEDFVIVRSAVEDLDQQVCMMAFKCVNLIDKLEYWNEPSSREIRQLISRLSRNPLPLETEPSELKMTDPLEGLRKVVEKWPVEEISNNHQIDEILKKWLPSLDGEEDRRLWVEISWKLWESKEGLHFDKLGSELIRLLMEQLADSSPENHEEITNQLREIQSHPQFSESVEILEFAKQAGSEYDINDEDDIEKLSQDVRPGDIVLIPSEKDWSLSAAGSYEWFEFEFGEKKNRISFVRETIDGKLKGKEWVVLDPGYPFGILVAPLGSVVKDEEAEDEGESELQTSPEHILNFCEEYLSEQVDYIPTAYLGILIGKKFNIKVSTYLKQTGTERKMTDFLANSRIGDRISLIEYQGMKKAKIKLLKEPQPKHEPESEPEPVLRVEPLSQARPERDVGLIVEKLLKFPFDPIDSARCLELTSDRLHKTRVNEWPKISKKVLDIMRDEEGCKESSSRIRRLAYRATAAAYTRTEEIRASGGTEIDVSPIINLDRVIDWIDISILPQNPLLNEKAIQEWKEVVKTHLDASPLIKTLEKSNAEEMRERFSKMTVPELKERLRKNQLPVSGRKADLVDRLIQYIYSPE